MMIPSRGVESLCSCSIAEWVESQVEFVVLLVVVVHVVGLELGDGVDSAAAAVVVALKLLPISIR